MSNYRYYDFVGNYFLTNDKKLGVLLECKESKGDESTLETKINELMNYRFPEGSLINMSKFNKELDGRRSFKYFFWFAVPVKHFLQDSDEITEFEEIMSDVKGIINGMFNSLENIGESGFEEIYDSICSMK
jgi:hypothetical protein